MYEETFSPWCYGELCNNQNEGRGSNSAQSRSNREHCYREELSERTIDASTNIKIIQKTDASGGDGGDGGNSGNAVGGSATAASAACGSLAVASASSEADSSDFPPWRPCNGFSDLEQDATNEERLVNGIPSGGAAATGGSAATAPGGAGGNGGAGGTATSTASVTVENVVVILSNERNDQSPLVSLGLNQRQLDISMDESGNTFVNGEKMDEKTLTNGVRVFLFRDSQTESSTTE